MNQSQKLFSKILNESLNEKAEEITKKIKEKVETTEDVDTYDLEVGSDYGFDDDDEDYTFIRKGKNSSHGPFHFKRNKRGGDAIFGEKLLKIMKRRIKEDDVDLNIALASPNGEKTEGNAFTKKLKDTPKGEKFKLGNKTYTDNSELEEDLGGMGLGMGHDDFENVNFAKKDEDENLQRILAKYMRNYDSDVNNEVDQDVDNEVDQDVDFVSDIKKESVEYRVKMSDGDFLDLTESELVDMIEELVTEEKVKDNLKKTGKPAGLVQYDRVSKKDKKENQEANQASFKKMADYVKAGSKGKFESNPVMFPQGNGELGKMDKKAYIPSEYVDEYVDAFAYPGQTNLVYDEIKPNDEWIEMNIKGSSKTGNAQVDEDGNVLGNVVPTKTGDKFYKNYEENLYGAEQLEASYKRQSQPVDIAGETTQKGSIKKKGGKTSSVDKANKILTKLGESRESESSKLLNEEMETMKKLIGYGYKK
jgi:hypothetical protein